mgnify:CR=1 FL=1
MATMTLEQKAGTAVMHVEAEYTPPRSWRTWLIGRPLATADAPHQTIGKIVGLAVFASDALSSTAYATQEILVVLEHEDETYEIAGIPVAGGARRVLKALGRSEPRHVSISPDGSRIAYDRPPQEGNPEDRDVFILPTGGGGEIHLAPHRAVERMLVKREGVLE